MVAASIVFTNGVVVTMAPERPFAEAAAVRKNRIVAVGRADEVSELVGAHTEVIDLKGRSLLPGFCENHIHISTIAGDYLGVDCSPAAVRSIEDIVKKIRDAAETKRPGEWVIGWGFDHNRLKERRYPTRVDLDPVSPQHPVAVRHRESMSWTCNSEALLRMGIDQTTPDPPGGALLRDSDGRPLGPMWDNCRVVFLRPALPKPSVGDLIAGHKRVMSLLNRMGITSANEASIVSADQLQAWQHLRDDGALTLRLYLNIYPVYGDDWDRDTAAYSVFNSGLRTGFGDDWLRLGPAVIGVDGGVQGETAALFQPYANSADPTYRGKFRVSEELLRDFCMEAQQRGFQIGAVAHGDWAISVTMDAIEAAAKAFPRGDTRHRLEHAYLWTPELLTRARTLGLVVSSQPPILEALGEACTVTPWGEERAAYAFPYRTMLTLGLVASGGSDMPVANANPWEGVRALVVREIEGLVGKRIIGPDERLSILDALRVYTYNGAFGDFAENRWGSIEIGKAADFVFVSHDVTSMSPAEIVDVQTVATYVGGQCVYAAGILD